jgi:4-hydroxy-2-oxoheptanedioate aldolase
LDAWIGTIDQILEEDKARGIRAAGKAAGMLSGEPDEAARYLESGFTFVAVGSDIVILGQGAAKRAADFRRQVTHRSMAAKGD